jgi:hypothetical protein
MGLLWGRDCTTQWSSLKTANPEETCGLSGFDSDFGSPDSFALLPGIDFPPMAWVWSDYKTIKFLGLSLLPLPPAGEQTQQSMSTADVSGSAHAKANVEGLCRGRIP